MQDSITIAEVGSMVKVSGSRIATPFGPPSPGSTPTKIPSTSPTIIRARVFHVIRTAKPCSSRPKASIGAILPCEDIVGGRVRPRLQPHLSPLAGRGRLAPGDAKHRPEQVG